jgi:hypothetical protein
MPCNASYTRFIFLKVFHVNYNLICIFICTPICTNLFILVKSECYTCPDVTPHVTNSLILIISVLIMHRFHWLINF